MILKKDPKQTKEPSNNFLEEGDEGLNWPKWEVYAF